ncbi:rRNA methyltransferase 3, mitochondrial-like [Mytilus edulis]|uniref:rRNA methyltransferase 3, mitochondrial-like n=1 Tax=Mytilus edulis TaxID=6550 RepID=UPI0039F082EB
MSAPMRDTVYKSFLYHRRILKVVSRNYGGGFRRAPVNVITPEQEREKLNQMGVKIKDPRKNANVKFLPNDPVQKNLLISRKSKQDSTRNTDDVNFHQQNTKIYHTNGIGIEYSRIEETDTSKKLNQIVMNANSKKQKGRRSEVLLEGRRLIIDALKAKATMKALYFSKLDVLDKFPAEMIDCPVYKVPHKNLKIWCETDTPQGILGIFEIPNEGETISQRTTELPLTVICDNLRDPGNMGTLVRTAAAVGCSKFITLPGCVDIWNSKVLRSGAGGHFRVPIINNLSWDNVINYIPNKSTVFIADTRRPTDWSLDDITKPDYDDMDEESQDNSNSLVSSEEELGDTHMSKRQEFEMYKRLPLNVSLYTEVDFTLGDHTVLFVGGEMGGFGVHARKITHDNDGQCVMLPMATGINSLNSSVTASILLYEIHKQYTVKDRNNDGVENEMSY